MSRWGPLITLGFVVVLGGGLLAANGTTLKSAGAVPAPAASTAGQSSVALHALYAGRSSGGQAAVAIAINGHKAAADLHVGRSVERTLQGSVTGNQIVLTGRDGAALTGSISGPAMFGTVTADGGGGQSFPFSAEQAVVHSVYAGRSSGNEETLAVSINGDKAAAYVCNGRTAQAWLQGPVTGSHIALAGRNGANLTGSISGLAMFGTVTVAGNQNLPFSAELAARPAGVYRANVTINRLATKIGWAVLPDGTQVGLAVADGASHPAPPLDLSNGRFTVGGETFVATSIAGTDTVVSP
jgi:hypothetical protein